jgi:PTH1 family peptidyl-tRNA hydrolase
MENRYLIVGLGNPGAEYARTRHNAGFQVADLLAERWRSAWAFEKKFNALVAAAKRAGRRVLVCKPQTYMNASGQAVVAVVGFYRVALPQLLVLVDDADLPLGALRLKPFGGSGGHHGLESVQQHLGTREYARLRIGIGRQEGTREITGYVLGRFQSTEQAAVDKVLSRASEAAECWMDEGIEMAMTRFNGAPPEREPPNQAKEQ